MEMDRAEERKSIYSPLPNFWIEHLATNFPQACYTKAVCLYNMVTNLQVHSRETTWLTT